MNNQEKHPSFGTDDHGNPIYPRAEEYVAEADKIMIEARMRKTGSFVSIKFDPSGEPISTVMGLSDAIRIE